MAPIDREQVEQSLNAGRKESRVKSPRGVRLTGAGHICERFGRGPIGKTEGSKQDILCTLEIDPDGFMCFISSLSELRYSAF
ncbi:hypothetical protein VZ95_19000 [Elstera litoralis]|uniref:Uncharacterized protein n=1 Tax=Elstera litoralis TaxID=552518 RepID=A0A0F3IRN6_9PROT|nr:hypothetical protein VZ95_19000 [Elstera litoralis]